jgi:SAM-dependent methyltransferase
MLNSPELLFNEATAESAAQPAVRCCACGGSDTRPFLRDSDRQLWRCSKCRLLFVFPQPSASQLNAEFQESYFGREASRLETDFERYRRPVLAQIAGQIHKKKLTGRLLDVGCASGELFTYFPDQRWQLCGLEPSRLAFQRAKNRFGSDSGVALLNGYLQDLQSEQSWDVITILESLYYMPDPLRELTRVSRILADDGLLLISVPGSQYQRVRHLGIVSRVATGRSCSLTRSHLYYFSEASLTALLRAAGLVIFDKIPLVSPEYGSRLGNSVRRSYVAAAKVIRALTFRQVDLSLHVLYLCRKSNSPE